MGKKQTKRSKKFQASGGVKKRIENGGTITKHGKLRKSRSSSNNTKKDGLKEKTTTATIVPSNNKKEHRSDDFITGSDNAIGKLDFDTFFDKLSDHIDESILQNEGTGDDDDDDDDEIMSDDNDDNSNNDNDDDENDNESEDSNDDNDDDDSTEDIDAVEAKMKRQLEKMEQTDPDFHKFLKDNEQSLLEFGNDDDESDDEGATNIDEDDNEDDDDEDDDLLKKGKSIKDGSSIVLTPKLLQQLSENAFVLDSGKKSGTSQIKALKSILVAYNCACHLSDPVTNDTNNTKASQQQSKNSKYTIESSKVFDDLMVLCLQYCGITFRELLLPSNENDDENNDNNEEKTTTVISSEKPIKPNSIEKSNHYTNVKPLIIMFYNSTIHLLNVGNKDPQLLSYVLRSLSSSIPLLSPFQRTAEQLLKSLVSLWCTSSIPTSLSSQGKDTDDDDDDNTDRNSKENSKKHNMKNKSNNKGKKSATTVEEDYQQVRLNAFFRIRQLALTQPYPFLDSILKKVYLAYAKRSKFSNSGGGSSNSVANNLQISIQIFLCNCVVELYSIDYHSAYQHAFVYIRQLALLLRTAIQKKTIEDIQNVYCYQYFECCTVWTKLLCSTASSNETNTAESELMKSLVYPLVEILYGIVRFTPQPIKYIPSRFYIIRLLQQLASCTTTFIPTSSLLLDCFDYKELYMSLKKHNTKQQKSAGSTTGSVGGTGGSSTKGLLHIQSLIRLPGKGDYLRYYEQIEPCMKELFVLLQREIELYKYSAGFPEFTIRIQVRVKQYLKAISSSSGKNKSSSNNSRYRVYAKGLLESIETYTKQALIRRSTLQESPKDVVRLECLLRPNEKTMMERHEAILSAEQQQYIELYQLSNTASAIPAPTSSLLSKRTSQKVNGNDNDDRQSTNLQLMDAKKKKPIKNQTTNESDDDDDSDVESSDDDDDSMNDVEGDSDANDENVSLDKSMKNQKSKLTNNNKKRKNTKMTDNQAVLGEEELMKVSDDVKEGIEWSSSDDDDDNDSNGDNNDD
jgi:nucleolar complex protein 2